MAFHEDPLLVHWAIGYLHDTEFARPDPRKFIEETFLSPSAVRYYFDTWEPYDLNVLIGLVPDPVLAEHADRLVEIWPTLPYRAAIDAAAFLARHDNVRAASLFEAYLSAPDTVRPRQVVGILQSLNHLTPEATRRIIDLAQPVIETLADTDDAYAANIARITAALRSRHPAHIDLIRRFLSEWASERGEGAYANHLDTICSVLFGDHCQFGIIRDYVLGFTKQSVSPVAAFIYQSGLDITAVDNILRPLRINDRKAADRAVTLLESVPQGLVAATVGEPAWEDLIALVEQGFSQPSSPKAKRIWHGVMALAGVLSVHRRDRLDLSEIHNRDVWPLIAADMRLPPGLDKVGEHLRTLPLGEVTGHLTRIAREHADDYGAVHAADLMAQLGDPAFLPVLIDLMNAEFEESRDAAIRAVETFGDAAIEYLDQHFDRLPEFVRILTLGLAVRNGSPGAVGLIDRHWDAFLDESDYELGEAVLALDEPVLNERLKGMVGQNLQGMDRAFVILGLLYGGLAEEHREIEKLVRSQFDKDNRRQHAFLVETLDGDLGVPRLDVPLTCIKCGHTATYAVHEVWVLPDASNPQPFLAEDIACTACGAVSQFEFTPEAIEAITAKLADLPQEDWFFSRSDRFSPVKRRSFTGAFGEKLSAQQLLAQLGEGAVKGEAYRLLRLGHAYHAANRFVEAERLYRQAIDTDPAWVEAYYGLADTLERREQIQEAIAMLEAGARHGKTLPCRRPLGWPTLGDFIHEYLGLHTKLAAMAGQHGKLAASMFATKVHRNDPCPVGTGKKVKKCCGGEG
ncbi:tetratricopeptide repeat protein [Skermanella pratensis]|uniref:tetratricopeptide repeat protein n=1 Tax=Skermanella pratensis TaxID=2233999 RepID=UPI00130122AC|nr:tetratricopeptide repeat protein [Skermanella pratensis]